MEVVLLSLILLLRMTSHKTESRHFLYSSPIPFFCISSTFLDVYPFPTYQGIKSTAHFLPVVNACPVTLKCGIMSLSPHLATGSLHNLLQPPGLGKRLTPIPESEPE